MQSLPQLTLPPIFLRSHCNSSSNKASLSRNLHAVAPSLVHTLRQEENSILSVATSDDHIYSGSQNQNISVRRSFLPLHCSLARARSLTRWLTRACRSGIVAPILSRHNFGDTREACSLSNTRRKNIGYLARQVCVSVSIPRVSANHRIDNRRQLRPRPYSISNSGPPSRSLLTIGVGHKGAYPTLRY